MVRAYAAFANGGWLIQPTVIAPNADGTTLKEVPHQAPKRILTKPVVDGVINALESVTEEGGTGTQAALEGYRVAGKTGTAQVVDPLTKAYSKSKHIASFIGFPVGVEPKLVILVALDQPKGVYFAAQTAAPLFKKVLQAAVNRLSIPANAPIHTVLAKASPSTSLPGPTAASARTPAKAPPSADTPKFDITDKLRAGMAHPAPPTDPSAGTNGLLWKMPSLQGLTPREAFEVLQGHVFHIEIQGQGIIHSQSPEEGKMIADGAKIWLKLSEP
jgi:cell division protein FtsI (penicillin-binding protein 3)